MVLVPATMELLGDRNWWLPGWLDRLLPNIHVEGHEVTDDELGVATRAARRQSRQPVPGVREEHGPGLLPTARLSHPGQPPAARTSPGLRG